MFRRQMKYISAVFIFEIIFGCATYRPLDDSLRKKYTQLSDDEWANIKVYNSEGIVLQRYINEDESTINNKGGLKYVDGLLVKEIIIPRRTRGSIERFSDDNYVVYFENDALLVFHLSNNRYTISARHDDVKKKTSSDIDKILESILLSNNTDSVGHLAAYLCDLGSDEFKEKYMYAVLVLDKKQIHSIKKETAHCRAENRIKRGDYDVEYLGDYYKIVHVNYGGSSLLPELPFFPSNGRRSYLEVIEKDIQKRDKETRIVGGV